MSIKCTVFLNKNVPGVAPITETLYFDDDATEEEIEEDCEDCINTLIANNIDTGWIRNQ